MENTFAKVDELIDHTKAYMNNRIDLVKLNAAEKGSKLMADMITIALVLLVFGFCLLFASIALALTLGRLTGDIYQGFLIVSGIYLVLGLLVWVMKEKLLRLPILNSLLKKLFKENNEKD